MVQGQEDDEVGEDVQHVRHAQGRARELLQLPIRRPTTEQ